MRRRSYILLVLAVTFSLTLPACGGGGGGDPVGVVMDMIKTIQEKKFDQLSNLICVAKEEEIASRFDVRATLIQLLGPDIDSQKVLDATVFEFINMEYAEISRNDARAIVQVKGRLKVTIDPDKLREPIRELLSAQGAENVTDSLVDQTVSFALEQFGGFGEDIDATFGLVKEDNKWLLCSD